MSVLTNGKIGGCVAGAGEGSGHWQGEELPSKGHFVLAFQTSEKQALRQPTAHQASSSTAGEPM